MDVHDSTITLDDKAIVRFWAKVDRSGGPDACWPWTAHLKASGYGEFFLAGRDHSAHRIALAIDGRDPGPLFGCHHCDNRPCCNPAHLWVGTKADNNADMIAKGRHSSGRGERHSSRVCPERLARGSRHGLARLTEVDIPLIRAALARGETQVSIAARHGVGETAISKIKHGKAWVHVPHAGGESA